MAKSNPSPAKAKANPDRAALVRVGERVRARLARDPAMSRIPVEQAELFTMAGFLSPAECDRFIAMIDTVAKPSTLYSTSYDTGIRTSYSGDVDPTDPLVRMVTRRLDDLLGLDGSWGETVQGQRYHPGQEFHAHYDWFNTAGVYWPDEVKRGGRNEAAP